MTTPAREFEGWEQWYARSDYRRMPWFSPRPSPWLVQTLRARPLARGSRVLDAGCGAGTNAIWLARRGARVVGVDVSPTALAVAQARARRAGVSIDFRQGSATEIPCERASVDAGLDTGLFHSLPLRLRARYASEMARTLRPEAWFLLTWIPREVRTDLGPPHRPSLTEVATAFEPWFVFERVEWFGSGTRGAWKVLGQPMGRCTALLIRRRGRQPPPL
jgi:SAM-dependent methyltransferase